LAGTRALAALPVIPDLILLDGNYDWLTDPGRVGLLGLCGEGVEAFPVVPGVPVTARFPVRTMIKADMFCSSVAAASVLAKVERDAMMVALAGEVPGYAWELNKGYSAPEHFAALEALGPSVHHRLSWRLPGVRPGGDTVRVGMDGIGVREKPVMHDGEGADRTERGGSQWAASR
ncbi:MAG TPA: hypothetical protein VIJ15_06275, partial [Dermatophilaceae bacterium]